MPSKFITHKHDYQMVSILLHQTNNNKFSTSLISLRIPLPPRPAPRPNSLLHSIHALLHRARPLINLLRRPLLYMMLLRLLLHIVKHIPPLARAIDPVQDAPAAIIRRPFSRIMDSRALDDAAHDDARHDGVARHGERFLAGAEGQDKKVREDMRAQYDGGQIQRDEAVVEQRERMVRQQTDAEWRAGLGMRVALMALCQPAEAVPVQDEAVDVVQEGFARSEQYQRVLEDLPRKGQRRGRFEDRFVEAQYIGEAECSLNGRHDDKIEEDQA